MVSKERQKKALKAEKNAKTNANRKAKGDALKVQLYEHICSGKYTSFELSY